MRERGPLSPEKMLIAYLWASGLVTAGVSCLLAVEVERQQRELGVVGWRNLAALGLGLLITAATPLAVRRLSGWQRSGERPFTRIPAYYRAVGLLNFSLFLAAIFGSGRDLFTSLAFHLFIAVLVHRLALCFPSALQRCVEELTRRRPLRILDGTLTNLAVTVVLVEVALRIFVLVEGGPSWLGAPGDPLAARLERPLFGFEPNSLGYNDREFVEEKRPGHPRIAAIGDSFLVAHVPRPYGVVARTRSLLEQRMPGRAPEILNFAVAGAGPSEYLEILRTDALRYRPDAVLVNFYVGNDISDLRGTKQKQSASLLNRRGYLLYRAVDHARHVRESRTAAARAGFVDLTRITRLDREYWLTPGAVPAVVSRERYLRMAARHLERCDPAPDFKLESRWRGALETLGEIEEECDRAGIPMLLAISPDHGQISPQLRREIDEKYGTDSTALDLQLPQKRLLAFCAEKGIPCLDLLPAFERAAREISPDHLYLSNDSHWSALGNQVAAEALSSWIEERLSNRLK